MILLLLTPIIGVILLLLTPITGVCEGRQLWLNDIITPKGISNPI